MCNSVEGPKEMYGCHPGHPQWWVSRRCTLLHTEAQSVFKVFTADQFANASPLEPALEGLLGSEDLNS